MKCVAPVAADNRGFLSIAKAPDMLMPGCRFPGEELANDSRDQAKAYNDGKIKKISIEPLYKEQNCKCLKLIKVERALFCTTSMIVIFFYSQLIGQNFYSFTYYN